NAGELPGRWAAGARLVGRHDLRAERYRQLHGLGDVAPCPRRTCRSGAHTPRCSWLTSIPHCSGASRPWALSIAVTRSRGSAVLTCPSRPTVVSARNRAFKIASSVASTTLWKSASIAALEPSGPLSASSSIGAVHPVPEYGLRTDSAVENASTTSPLPLPPSEP